MTKNKTLLTSIATTISFVVAFVFALTIFFTVPNKKAHAEAEPFTERPDSIKYDTGSYNDAILSEVEGKKSDDYHGAFTVFIYSDEDCNNEVTGAMNEIGTFYAKVSWTADGDYSDGSCTFGFLVQPKDVTIDNTIFETDPTLLESSYGNYVPLLDNDSLDAKGLTMDALGLKANAGDDIDLSFEFYDHSTGEPLEGVGNGHTLNAGTYHIRPVLSGNDADKYMLTGQEWEYVINPKQVSFYLYYNNAEYNGSSIVYDGQIKNFTLVRDELDDTQVSATIDSWIFYNEVYRTKEEIHTTVYMEDVLLAGQYSDPQTTITPLDNSGLVASNYEVYISNTSTITVDKAELNGLLTISQSKWMFGEEISNFKQKMSMNFSGLTSDNKEEWFEIEYKLSSSSGDTGTFYSVVPLPNVLKPTVNTYVMGASIAESVNYNALTDDTLFPTCTLTISKAEVYAIPDELEITYTGESLKPEFTFELYHKDSGIHPESYYGIGSMAVAMDDTGGNRIDCGMYSSTLVIKSGTYEDGTYSDFFVLVDESDGSTREYVSISYNIVPKELILSVEFSDLTYGNSVLVPTWNYKDNDDSTGIYITGFVEKDLDANDLILSELQAQYSVHFEYATSYSAPDEDWSVFTPKDAGTYYVRMYVSGFENYKDGVIISTYPFKINPKVADFAWTNLVFDYDGEQHAPTATVTNLEEGDECTVTVSSTGCNAYSGYTTMAFSLSNENYTITNDSLNRTSPSYEIRKLNVYVLPHSSQSKIYGSDDPVLDFAYTGSILNQELVFEGALSREAGENVGTYNITLGTLALKGGVSVNANYTLVGLADGGIEFEIEKKEIGLSWTQPANLVYSNTPKNPTVEATGLVGEDELNVTIQITAHTSNYNVGTFTFDAVEIDNNNYKLPTLTRSPEYTITPKEVTLVWTAPSNLVYNGAEKTPTLTLEGLCDGAPCQATISLYTEAGTNVNVGTFKFEVVSLTSDNYSLPDNVLSPEYTITPKEVILEWEGPASNVYSKTAKLLTATVTNLEGEDECLVTVALHSGDDNVNVGFYKFDAVSLSNPNYTLPEDKISPEFEIQRKLVILEWHEPEDLVYDGTSKMPSVTLGGLLEGDNVSAAIGLVNENNNINVGMFKFEATSISNTNYKLPVEKESPYYTITKREVTLNWTAPEDLVYSATYKTPTVVAGNLVLGDICDVTIAASYDADNMNVGTFTFDATALSNNNYKLPAVVTSPVFTITQKEVTLVWTAPIDLAYNGAQKKATLTVEGVVGTDNVYGIYRLNEGSDINAGIFNFICYELNHSNYKLPADPYSPYYTITPKEVSLFWTKPENLIYNKEAKVPTVELVGVISTDSCTATTALASGDNINVGTFTYKVTAISNANYVLPTDLISPEYEIIPKTLTLSWTAPQDLYYNGEAKTPTAKISGVIEGDECTVSASKNSGDNVYVGSFTFSANSLSNTNYRLPVEDTSPLYTILPRTVDLAWIQPADLAYNKEAKVPTVSVYGTIPGDTCTATAVLSTGCDNINVGTFTYTVTALSNTNYVLPTNVVSPKYEIKPIIIEWTWVAPQDLVYNAQLHMVTTTPTNLLDGDVCKVIASLTSGKDNVNVGKFTFTATHTTNSNYILPENVVSPEYEITKAVVTLTWAQPESLVYNGTAKTPTAKAKGIFGNDTCDVAVVLTEGKDNVNVGTFTFTATSLSNDNYVLPAEVESLEYEITKAEVELAWTAPQNLIYDGHAKTPSAVAQGLFGSDTCDVTIALTQGKDNVNVGTFTFTATSLSNPNYKLPENVVSPEYKITLKAVTLVWTAPTNLEYNGDAKLPTVVVEGLNEGDSCTATIVLTEGKDNKNVGTFTFTVTELSNDNYSLPEDVVSPEYTITAKEVTLTWTAPANLVYNKQTKTPTITVGGLVDGDTCTATVALTQGKDNVNVGKFTFTASALSNSNYKLPSNIVSGEYTITPKEVTLTWSNTEFTYDKASHKPTVTLGNIESGDNVEVNVSGEKTNAGQYTATASITNPNYKLPSDATHSFTINKAKAEINLDNFTKELTYNRKDQTFTGATGTGEITYENNVQKKKGTYEVVIKCAESENYLAGEIRVQVSIVKGSGCKSSLDSYALLPVLVLSIITLLSLSYKYRSREEI